MMKKILCLALALAMALGCAAFAEEDLQAQLDAANAKIAELQAQVDAYYPYYFAQIAATYGDDGVIWLEDVQAEYDLQAAQYAQYGLDLESMGLADMAKQSILEAAVQEAVINAKAEELGLAEMDDEAMAELEALAQQTLDYYVDYFISSQYADAEEITDEMTASAVAYWESVGTSYDAILESYIQDAVYTAVEEYILKDVAITEEDVQAAYETMVENAKADYADDATYNSDRTSGSAIAYNPEGYRAVKHVLVKFSDEQSSLLSELNAQLESLNAEKEAIENPTEETEATEETAEPRSIEEINADIAACAMEVEALYSQLLPTATEVIEKFNAGTSFDELIAEYNADPGMTNEPTASQGYAVKADSTYWDSAFTQGAMSIAEIGGISEPVYGSYGIHVIYYMDDIAAGEVALDEIRADVEETALAEKEASTYNNTIDAWIESMNVEYHYANFGINL